MEFVEAVSRRHGEGARIRERVWALLDQRLQVLGEEPLGLLASLPHVEDPEHTGLVVETGGVRDQPVEGSITDLFSHEVVVLGRDIRARELLNGGRCQKIILRTDTVIVIHYSQYM